MKKLFSFILLILFLATSLFYNVSITSSDELDDVTKQIQDLTDQLNQSINATKPLESELIGLRDQINGIKGRLSSIEVDIKDKEEDIEKGYEDLAKQEVALGEAIRNFYIKSYYNTPFIIFFSSSSVSDITQALAYQKAITDQDKAIITNIALAIRDLETKKAALENEKIKLASLKSGLDVQSEKLDEIVTGAKNFQSDLSGKIAELSSRQQEIINARSGSFTFTLGSGDLADEYLSSSKGFQESAPGGYFAVFSFGGYSHRKGMSQYGARGRAESGQNYKQILSKYYGKEPVSKDTGGNIRVAGYGEMDFETTYLYGIAEMPSSWHADALKAQAIAARTYAYRYKVDGNEICTTQACQVFNKGKSDNPPQAWKDAVDQTKGEVLEDVVTYYSSTSGGFLTTSGWDTTDGSGGSNFIEKSYERLGNSPWLEKMWWRDGYSVSGNTCGRSTPWLSPQEMADIVNAAIALRTGGIDTTRITPVTTSCWGGNPYSMDELKNLVSGHGGISSATSVSVSQGNGTTNSISINGVSLSPSDFRQAFNLRAPGYLRIPQYPGTYGSPFFNVVKK